MNRMRFMRFALVGTLALLVAGFAAPTTSWADTFDLTDDHCSGGCAPAGTVFGTVTLTQNGTTVDVTVHLNSPFRWARTGAADFMAFKFNATGVALGDITVNSPVGGQTLAAVTGALNGDGTGNFSFGIQCTSCGGGLSTVFSSDITFHVANATIADLTHANSIGIVFVADIGNPLTGATGPVGSLGPVPEPSTIFLYGLGVAMLIAGHKWRKSSLARSSDYAN